MQRLYYVDNLRSACMLMGLWVHTNLLADFGPINHVDRISAQFRMATFFVIAGFLGAMLYQRGGTPPFLRHRARTLALPLVVSLVVLNPVAFWLVMRLHEAMPPEIDASQIMLMAQKDVPVSQGSLSWTLHLWFLVSLTCFALLTPAAMAGLHAVPLRRLVHALGRDRWRSWVPFLVALAVAAVSVLTALARDMTPLGESWLVVATLQYLPFYVIGALFFVHQRLWEAVHTIDLRLIVLLLGIYSVKTISTSSPRVELMLDEAQLAVVRCTITFALLFLFRQFMNRTNPLFRALSGSIYTVYLFHFLLIYLLGNLWAQWFSFGTTAFFAISTSAGLLGYALHHFVISRSRLLSLAFNGKPWLPNARGGEASARSY